MNARAGWAILVADDHQVLRAGLKRLLLDSGEVHEVGEAESAAVVRAKLRERTWHLLLLDLRLGGDDGLKLLEELKDDGFSVPTLVLSMYPESQFGPRALRAGAMGYVAKSAHPATLLLAIQHVLGGGKYITPVVAETLDGGATPATDGWAAHHDLSVEEQAVLKLIVAGRTEEEIAVLLKLNATTVSACRARVLQQLGLKDDEQLRQYAEKHGLKPPA